MSKKRKLSVFITHEDNSKKGYDVDVYDEDNGAEKDEELSKIKMTEDQAETYAKTLINTHDVIMFNRRKGF